MKNTNEPDGSQEIDTLTQSIQQDSANPLNYQRRATFYYKQKDYTSAITDISKAIELQPRNAEFYAWRSLINTAMKNYQTALLDNQTALEFNSNDPDYNQQHAIILHETGRYAEAMEYRKKALELEPTNSYNHEQLARTFEALGNMAEALSAITKAIELEPDYAFYYFVRAQMLRRQDNHDDAVVDLTRAIKLDPENIEYYRLRCNSYHNLDEFDLAMNDDRKIFMLLYHPEDLTYKAAVTEKIKDQVETLLTGDAVHNNPLMKAAAEGNLVKVDALLAQERNPAHIQAAFELAADAAYPEVARRLVAAGAYYNFEYDTSFEYDNLERGDVEGRRCPFCYTMCTLNYNTYCEHLVTMELVGDDDPDRGYDSWLEHLAIILQNFDQKEMEELEQEIPPEFAPLVKKIHQNGSKFWRNDPGVIEESWSTDGYIGWTCLYFFHPDPFFNYLLDDPEVPICWFKMNRIDLFDPSEVYLSFSEANTNNSLENAILAGKADRIQKILKNWPDVDFDANTILEKALNSNKPGVLEQVIKYGIKDYTLEEWLEPKISDGNIDLIKRLLQNLGSEYLDIQGMFYIAEENGQQEICKLLIEAGADPDK
jgi:tetratricopeptide (TPR) repeat protein